MTKVLHIFRTPLGGILRHIVDLVRGQVDAGITVGLVFDSAPAWGPFEALWPELQAICRAGCVRLRIPQAPAPRDITNLLKIRDFVRKESFDIIHGHTAKGGAYARLIGHYCNRPSIYTPHGGVLHYDGIVGKAYGELERRLLPMTGGIIFESDFARREFITKIARPPCPIRTIPNAPSSGDFDPIINGEIMFDFVYLGLLRRLKGIDVLLEAAGLLNRSGQEFSIGIFGGGYGKHSEEADFRRQAHHLQLDDNIIRWCGPVKNGHIALSSGRCLLVPSRHESFPYVVLEAAAAGMPIIATNVGGIPEIFGPEQQSYLLAPGDARALADAMTAFLGDPEAFNGRAQILRQRVGECFRLSQMVEQTVDFYAEVKRAWIVG